MSVSTLSTAAVGPSSASARRYRRSASSILSTDSDIRFTRRKLGGQYRCGCCVIASFLILLLIGAAAVYIGYKFYLAQPPDGQVFRANFKITDGDFYSPYLADTSTDKFRLKSRDYNERLNLLFRRSNVKHGFSGLQVLALDGIEGQDLIVHFNVNIDPIYVTANADDLKEILYNEATNKESIYFGGLQIAPGSIEVIENHIFKSTTPINRQSTRHMEHGASTAKPKIPRKCVPLQLNYCNKLPHNTTSYPNILGHESFRDVKEDVISFRELVDAECYRLAYDFVCHILQPACINGKKGDEMLLPCRSYCRDFLNGCGSRLNDKMKINLDCNKFPETGNCIPKPGCVKDLQSRGLSARICDGVADCYDLSDERSCTYCHTNDNTVRGRTIFNHRQISVPLHCGIGRVCIDPIKRCDGVRDCQDGSDERGCLSLASSVEEFSEMKTDTPHVRFHQSEGFVVFIEKGETGKLCTENLNKSLTMERNEEILQTVASSLCKTLSYRKLISVNVVKDDEENIPYVSMKDPMAREITFVRSLCPSKQVLKVHCDDLECGLQITHTSTITPTIPKLSIHGDWPWQVTLYKQDVHICDGTLISPNWIITSISCFQGQPKAEWIARVGIVRLSSTSPWQQERRIIGMVKSPVEGSTIALIKVDTPLMMNDFVRPVCLPNATLLPDVAVRKSNAAVANLHCNTLGWTRNRDQLQRVQVKLSQMEKCENISISNVNGMCAETAYGQEDCNEEEFAGSAMFCLLPDGVRWSIVGVTNWRIACASKPGVERPRMYDKITSNIDWLLETIQSENEKDEN